MSLEKLEQGGEGGSKDKVSSVEFKVAVLNRKDIIGRKDGPISENKKPLDKHAETIKSFVEQEKENFFASLPEDGMMGSQKKYSKDELTEIAEDILSGKEKNINVMTSQGEVNLRDGLMRILELMKDSGLDEYNLERQEKEALNKEMYPGFYKNKEDKENKKE